LIIADPPRVLKIYEKKTIVIAASSLWTSIKETAKKKKTACRTFGEERMQENEKRLHHSTSVCSGERRDHKSCIRFTRRCFFFSLQTG
jgi:hypothetical protein